MFKILPWIICPKTKCFVHSRAVLKRILTFWTQIYNTFCDWKIKLSKLFYHGAIGQREHPARDAWLARTGSACCLILLLNNRLFWMYTLRSTFLGQGGLSRSVQWCLLVISNWPSLSSIQQRIIGKV